MHTLRNYFLTLLVAMVGACQPILISEPPESILYFSDPSAVRWFGTPVAVEVDNSDPKELLQPRKIRQIPFDYASIDFSGHCKIEKLNEAYQRNFDMLDLRNVFRAKDNKDFIKQLEANWGIIKAGRSSAEIVTLFKDKKEDIKNLFSTDATKTKVELFFPFLVNSFVEYDSSPRSFLTFSTTEIDSGLQMKMTDKISAAAHYKNKSLFFFAVSETSSLSLRKEVIECLKSVAKGLSPKPTHIITSLGIGVLFKFKMQANSLDVQAKGSSGSYEISANVNLKNSKIIATLFGEVDPTNYKTSVADIYDESNKTPPDKQILKYFSEFSKSIETPVFMRAELTRIE